MNEVEGAKAIEVATMLGDSVVDVKHCIDPKSGKVSPRTWGLAAAGLSCVLFSAVAFASSVSNAAANKQGLEHWTNVAKKPASAYRPNQLSAGYDWVAFGGLALGIGALGGALLRMRSERRSPYYRIGTAAGVEQPVVGAPSESFPLVAPAATGDDFVFNFGAGVSGSVTTATGQSAQLAELAASGTAKPSATIPGAFELAIPMGGKINATIGQTAFVVSGVAKPREHASPLFAGMQSKTMGYFAGSLAAHLGAVLLLSYIPVDDSSSAMDLASIEDTGIRTRTPSPEDMPEEKLPDASGGGGEDSAAAAAMKLPEGATGAKNAPPADSHIRIKNRDIDPVLARAQAIEEARNAGVLGSYSLTSGDYFSQIDSTSNLASGFDGSNVYGAYGSEGAGGGFGYGRHGLGGGGGCVAEPCGIIGTGDGYGKLGLGKYGREGYGGPGGGGPGMRRRQPNVPTAVVGQPETSGFDKQIIRRHIKRNVDKITYCYEKQLLANPGISGTVMVQFFIAPNGTVQTSKGSGFDATVANCVADVISNIEFPKPPGGVQVNYPFTFHAAGGH